MADNHTLNNNERSLAIVPRRGMTLVEVCVAVAVSAILLGIAVTLLVRLQQWNGRFRDDATSTQQVSLLAELIRRDVRSATQVALETPQVLVVDMHDQRIGRYELTPSGCLRIVKDPSGKGEQRELFRVGPELIWNLGSGMGVRTHVTVVLERPRDEPASETRVLLFASANRGADLPPGEVRNSTK